MKKHNILIAACVALAITSATAQAGHHHGPPHRDLYVALDIISVLSDVCRTAAILNPRPVEIRTTSTYVQPVQPTTTYVQPVQPTTTYVQPVVTAPTVVQPVVTTPTVVYDSYYPSVRWYGGYYYPSTRWYGGSYYHHPAPPPLVHRGPAFRPGPAPHHPGFRPGPGMHHRPRF